MNSMAQHAVPKGRGQSELPRAQSTTLSTRVVRYVAPARSSTSRADSPGRVMSPFSAPSPGATPALRGMMELGFSIFWMGISAARNAGGFYELEKRFTSALHSQKKSRLFRAGSVMTDLSVTYFVPGLIWV